MLAAGTSSGPRQTVADAQSSPALEAVARRRRRWHRRQPRGRRSAFATARTVTVARRSRSRSRRPDAVVDGDCDEPVRRRFLHLLADPNIAFILFTLGFYGLIFELQNPNFVTGILGALAIILAFIGFGSLPLNVGGLLLIGLAWSLFVLELTVTSHGLLTIGGLVCFVLGAAALFTEPGRPTAPVVARRPG